MKRRTFDRIVSFVGLGLSVFLFVYADFYIGSHLKAIAGGKVYSEVSSLALAASAKSKAEPANMQLSTEAATLMGQRTSLFMGETLRGLLLYSFAFWQIGQIAMYAAWAAAAGGVLMLVLSLLGFAHIRRVEADATI